MMKVQKEGKKAQFLLSTDEHKYNCKNNGLGWWSGGCCRSIGYKATVNSVGCWLFWLRNVSECC